MPTDARRLPDGGKVTEKVCPRGHRTWRRAKTLGHYYCKSCNANGLEPKFDKPVLVERTPERKPAATWWEEYLTEEYGIDVLESDESPRDVYKRLHAEEGQSHEV
jgi:hypothetical protein